jgi:DNA-binding transcriptional ArsR family regulator
MDVMPDGNRPLDAAAPETPFDDAADMLRALAHPVRLKIVELLQDGELCVKGLEALLGVSQSSVSQHLSRLRYAGLIESERRGHLVCYRLAGPRAASILQAVSEGLTSQHEGRRKNAPGTSPDDRERDGESARPSDA